MSKPTKEPASPAAEQDTRRVRRLARQEQLRRERARTERNRYLRLGALAAVAVAILAALIFFVIVPSSGPTTQQAAQGRAVPIQGRQHIKPGDSHPAFNSVPATSGWHHERAAEWGVHDETIPDELAVHNLEHGGIVIRYHCPDGCPDLASQLRGLVRRYRSKVLLSPYDKPMERRIALTAWGWIDTFDDFDEGRVVAFINAHKNQGPEQVPD